MARVTNQFREHMSNVGFRHAVARSTSRACAQLAQRLQTLSENLVDCEATSDRLNHKLAADLAANRRLHGRHIGECALLLASGPSSAELSKSNVGSKRVIAVNEMFGPAKAAGLELAAVVIHDPFYFTGAPDMDRMLRDAAAVAHECGALMVLPNHAATRLIQSGVFSREQVLTFVESGRAIFNMPRPAHVLDMSKPVPSLQTVAHTGLVAALFLGFSEVAILGVDLGYVAKPIEPISHGYGKNQYNDSINTRSAAEAYLRGHGWSWPTVLRDVAYQLEAFDWIAEGASRSGQRVVNLSRNSLLAAINSIEVPP